MMLNNLPLVEHGAMMEEARRESAESRTAQTMDDIQKRADDKAWDKKQDHRISDVNRRIESGLAGEALAALHGLHVTSNDEPPCDVDDTSEVDDQTTLRDKIIMRLIQIGEIFSRNRDLPDEVKQKWTSMLGECYPSEAKSVPLLRDLKRELDTWEEIDPQSGLSVIYSAINAVATMIEIYQRRFDAR